MPMIKINQKKYGITNHSQKGMWASKGQDMI